MKTLYKLSFAIFVVTCSINLCLASVDNEPEIRINNVGYLNGQTAYIDCTTPNVQVTAGFHNAFQFAPNSWNVSSNFSYQYDPDIYKINLTLDPNREDGTLTIDLGGGNQVFIRITQKSTPSLTITPLLCTSGQSGNFSTTLNFYGPSSANVVWQTTGGITVNNSNFYRVTDNTISRARVQLNSFGTLTVYGEIPGCNNMQTKPVTYYIGTPSASDITFTGTGGSDPGSAFCSGRTVNFESNPNLSPSQYSYNWSIPQGSSNVSYFYSYGPNATVTAGSSGGFLLQMDVTNIACNTMGGTSRTFGIYSCGGYYRVMGNPTTDNLVVQFDPVDKVEYLPTVLTLSHEKKGQLKEVKVRERSTEERAKSGFEINLDVRDLPNDVYYLHGIHEDNKVQSIRVIISK